MANGAEQRRTVAPDVLEEVVRRVVQVANPEKIILFGSAARGEMGPNSDVDLLIVVRGPTHTGRLSTAVLSSLGSNVIKESVDAVVVTSESVERYRNSHALVIKPALREGRVLYEGPPGSRPPPEFDLPLSVESQMASDRFPPDDPREWLNRARSNLAMALALVPDAYLEDLCYQAQQAAKKAIKAVMIQRDIEFPYTHDIDRLLTVLSQSGEKVPEAVWAARNLTRFAFADRYPGNEPPLSEEDYQRNLAVAAAVVRWAEGRIGS